MADDISALKSLRTTLIDSLNGYQEALQDSNDGGLEPVFRDMIGLRTRHIGELAAIVRQTGETIDDTGSFMTTVHKTVVSIRAAVTGLDAAALPAFISGEQRNIQAYDQAVQDAPAYRAQIQKQRQELADRIAELERMQPVT
jgi:uncharacterized protein (TIGR02284 family)